MGATAVNGRDEEVGHAANDDDDDDERFSRCRLCGQLFVDPRMLPCLDTFCLHCVDDLCTANTVTNALSTSHGADSHTVTVVQMLLFDNLYYALPFPAMGVLSKRPICTASFN